MQAFSNEIFHTVVQHLTTFQETQRVERQLSLLYNILFLFICFISMLHVGPTFDQCLPFRKQKDTGTQYRCVPSQLGIERVQACTR